jgi:hypothetical protein
MTPQEARPYIKALEPLLRRVRTDKTAVKVKDGSSRWTADPLTAGLMAKHLNGGPARGVCPIKEGESVTLVGLLDFDSHGGETSWPEMTATLTQVVEALEADGYPSTAFRSSGGRGIHLILLWDEPQDAASVRAMMRGALARCGLHDGAGGVVAGQVEVFPKQDSVAVGGFGNQFILPLAGKSEPLDPLFGYEPMGKDWVTEVQWPICPDVPRVEVEARSCGTTGRGNSVSANPDPIDKVRSALNAIPNSDLIHEPDYDAWFRLGCAVHEATGGSLEGLKAFQEWSAQSLKHDGKFTRERVWNYLRDADGRSGNAITRGTLYKEAGRFGWVWMGDATADGFEDVPDEVIQGNVSRALAVKQDEQRARFEAKEAWKKAVAEAPDEITLVDSVCPKIARDSRLDDFMRGALAEAVKGRLAVFGSKVALAQCRKLIAPPKVVKADQGNYGWADGWVFVTDRDQFFRLDSDEWLTMMGFNARFNRFLPPAEQGALRKTAAWTALEDIGLDTVTRGHYIPWLGPRFDLDTVPCINLFRASSVPEAASSISQAGQDAVDKIVRHLDLIAGGRKEVSDVLLHWMAHNVQYPGKKIRWAPLIKGIEGDGKSLLGRVMAAVLGAGNVKDIGPRVLGTDFTDWAHGACVGVLEEIRLSGHNRHDVLNALKPYLTNTNIAIHPKGKAEFNTLNTMNYVAFTNHSDALPLHDTDRRWFVVFTPFREIAQLESKVGNRADYFSGLFKAIENHREELRRWLLDVQIPASFDPDAPAPATAEKGQMVALEVSDEEDEIAAVIDAGCVGVGAEVLSTSALTTAIRNAGGEPPKGKTLAKHLLKLGWMKVPQLVKWRGDPHRLWVKFGVTDGVTVEPSVTAEVLRNRLDLTLGGEKSKSKFSADHGFDGEG